jgi:pimeloyl-ACP methyl ester carboxylesterase
MKRILFLLTAIAVLFACAPLTGSSNSTSSPTSLLQPMSQPTSNPGYTQDASSTATPQTDPAPRNPAPPSGTSQGRPVPVSNELIPADEADTYWVVNPSSGSRLFVRVAYPRGWNGEPLPALALLPGGTGKSDPQKAARLSAQGFLVVIFDPDGRGRSEGTEDYNGFIGQDGLAAVINAAASLPGLDAERFGLVSYSYGVTLATGALARHPDLPIDFYIDWEGPVDRTYTTVNCGRNRADGIQWHPCEDDAWWSEREAMNFIAQMRVPYQRIQSQKDHVQATNNHAIDIVNAAVAAGLPWVRLNEYPANQTYDASDQPAMLPDNMDKQIDKTVANYARYIIENVLGK